MEKRKFLLALTAAVLVTSARAADPFQDVPQDHPARASVEKVVDLGVLEGYDGRFHGEKLINRYQVSVLAKRTMDVEQLARPAFEPVEFTDVPRFHWARKAIELAVARGYLTDYPWGDSALAETWTEFHGEKLVNRYQLAVFLAAHVRAVRPGWAPSVTTPLPEDVPPGHPTAGAVRLALDIGLLELRDGRFQGERLVNRFQLAEVLARLLPG